MEISFFSVLFINSIRTESRCLGKVEKTQINVANNSKKKSSCRRTRTLSTKAN